MKRQQDDDEWSRMPPSKLRYNEDDEFGIDGVPDPPAFFKKSTALTIPEFLFKFTSEEVKKIDTFVQKHKALLKLPPPTKISIFEDAYMLREFIRYRQTIAMNKKHLDPICKRLEGILKRASITIRERLTKKYVKTSIKEIVEAIDQNRHLIFEKNDRSKKNNPAFGVSPVKIEGHVSPLEMEGHAYRHHQENTKVEYKTEFREDDIYFDSETQSEAHRDRHQPSPIKKEEKSPIRKNKEAKKEKDGHHHPNLHQQQEHHSPREEQHCHPIQQEDTRLRQEASPKNGSLYRYGTKPIQKRIYIHANRRTHTFKAIPEQRLEEVLKRIQQNRNPPLPPPPPPPPPPPSFRDDQFRYDSPIHPKKEQSDISSNQSLKSITKSIKETIIPPIDPPRPKRTFVDDGIKSQLETKALASVSYNHDSLQIIKRDPSKRAQHVWTQEQDKLLGNFQMYRYEKADEMKCLLRYKPFNKIKERCALLDISLNTEDEEFFKCLAEQLRQETIKRAS